MFVDDILDKADQIKDSKGRSAGPRTRSAVAGIIIGGIVGIMVGYSKKWNLFYSTVTGAVIGGAAGSLLVSKK